MTERINHLPENINRHKEIPFIGFSGEQKQRVKTHIESIGFPSDNVREVLYEPGKKGQENLLGSFQPFNGKLTLYKSLEKLPPIAQHETIVHELAHATSPFDPKSEKFYGSSEAVQAAKNHAVAVAEQSKITHIYLNGYQAKLHEQLEADEIDELRFVEETRAIMMGLRFTNPAHLKQVESAQIEKINKIKETHPEASGLKSVNIIGGVDKTISILIPNLQSKEDIDKHVEGLKRKVLEQGRPLLPNQTFLKAA